MANNEVEVRSGVGLPTILTVIFVVLKLVGVIDWSWWWVLSPLWISFLISMALIIILSILVGPGSRR